MKPIFHSLAVTCVGVCVLFDAGRAAAEPYPFRTNPREFKKVEMLRIDFENPLPDGTELGSQTQVEAGIGTDGSRGLISSGKGLIAKFPVPESGIGISRFDLTLDYGGEDFARFRARLNAYCRDEELLRSVSIGSGWGYAPGTRTWRTVEANLEFEDIHTVELELEQTNDNGSVRLDNIILRRHEAPIMFGRAARGDLTRTLKKEGLEVGDVLDLWVATAEKRQSYFDFSNIEENKRYVRSDWPERLHIGTTYKTTHGRTPTFVLGVSARQAALEAAAERENKTLAEMYEFFLDDVAEHGFNTVWVDFTEDLETFDQLAAARDISIILRDPDWSSLESWVSNRDEPIPADFKKTVADNFSRYSQMESLLGYQMNRPLSSTYQPMLAEARKHLATVAPDIQLVTQENSTTSARRIEEPFPNLGIQSVGFHHYVGKPWSPPSHLRLPNSWPRTLTEGDYRRILDAFRIRTIPTLLAVPSGKQFGKKSISMQYDRVVTETTGWAYDTEKQRWSGWYRYQYPPNLLKSLVWKAVETGAGGILVEEWGPADVPADITGTEILENDEYAEGDYRPHLLRYADMSESEGWKELGEAARALAPYMQMLAVTTLHGHNNVRTNTSNVRVRTLTGRDDPFKVLALVNTEVGEYEEENVSIDPETGKLEEYQPAPSRTFTLTVEKDHGLIDVATGRTLEPKSSSIKDRSAKYELTIGPGEGRFLFRGRQPTFRRFVGKYEIPVNGELTRAGTN